MGGPATKSKRLEELAETFKERAGDIDHPELGSQYQMPLFRDLERAMPNHLARSSLFAPCARGRRKQHNGSELLMSRNDVRLRYTGQQLDMGDSDVFMQALYEAQRAPAGERVYIERAKFLRAMRRTTGKNDYDWLHQSMRRLFHGSIEVEAGSYKIGFTPSSAGMHLIDEYEYDAEKEKYFLRFNPRILALFSNNEYALIDWEKRHQLMKKVDMAKWLQTYLASHKPGIHRIGLKYLKQWMDFSSPMNKFRDALLEAMRELERVEIIANVGIEAGSRREQVAVWTKLPT